MLQKGIQWPGTNNIANSTLVCVNKTGGTRTKGDVVALDFANAQAETNVSLIGRNAVAVSAANIDGLLGVVVNEVDQEANSTTLEVCIQGFCFAKVDGGTVDVAAGDKLIATAASSNFTKSGATTDIVWARALQDNTGAAALKLVYLYGAPTAPGTAS